MELSRHKLHILTAMFVLIAFMLGCNEFMVIGNLSLIANYYHVGLGQVSWLVSIFAWSYAICTPILALATNHVHKYYLLITLLLIFLVGTVLSSLAPTFSLLMVSRVLTASVAGMVESLLSVIAYELTTDSKEQSLLVAWIYSGFSIASVVGVPLGTFIADRYRWQDAFVMVAVITVLATIIAFSIMPRQLSAGKGSYKDQLVLFQDKNIWLGIMVDIFSTSAIYGYYTYIRPLIHRVLGFTLDQLVVVLFVLGICTILSNQVSGWISARGGMRKMVPVYVAGLVLLGMLGLSLQNKWTGVVVLCVLSFVLYLFGAPLQVYFLDTATRKYPEAIMIASTLNAIFWNFGVAVSSPLAGLTLDHCGLTNLGWLSFVFEAVALVFLIKMIKNVKAD